MRPCIDMIVGFLILSLVLRMSGFVQLLEEHCFSYDNSIGRKICRNKRHIFRIIINWRSSDAVRVIWSHNVAVSIFSIVMNFAIFRVVTTFSVPGIVMNFFVPGIMTTVAILESAKTVTFRRRMACFPVSFRRMSTANLRPFIVADLSV